MCVCEKERVRHTIVAPRVPVCVCERVRHTVVASSSTCALQEPHS